MRDRMSILMKQNLHTVPLSDLCDISTGNKDVNEGSKTGPYPFFTCAEEIFSFDTYSFDGDAILIAGNGNFSVKKYSGRFEAYQRTYVLQKFKINFLFLYHYIFHKLQDITRDNRGTTVRYIRIGNLCDYPIQFPSFPEQKEIVNVIEELSSDLDNAIENLKKAQEQLKIYRLAVLKCAFEGKFSKAAFEEVSIERIALSVTYGTSNKAEKSGVIPVLRMGDLYKGKIDYSNLKYYGNLDDLEGLLLEPGDLLFNRTNSAELVGKTSIFNGTPQYKQVTFASYLIRIRVDRDKVLPEYLNYWMNSPRAILAKNELKNQQVGQANINGTKLKNMKFPLASSLKIQAVMVQEIETRFSVCDQLEQTIEMNLQKAESLRQSILKQAFEGKLTEEWRKKHKDLISGQNSAEALLKKIMAEKAALNGKDKRIKNHD